MTSNDVITHSIFMKFRPRVCIYLSNISNFILIEHNRTEIQIKEVNIELKNGYYVTVSVTLTFKPRSPISIEFEQVPKATF